MVAAMDTGNQNTFENDVIIKIDAERLAQRIIDQSCRRKGWSMRNIVKMVRDEMGVRAGYHARKYVERICGYA